MSPAEHPAEPTQSTSPVDDEAYYRATLREMSERGMKLMRQADADPSLTLTEKVDIFERVSRAVRRTILLELHIVAQRNRATPAPVPRPPRPTTDIDATRAWHDERRERVETFDREPALFARPIPEIIAAIEQDLRPIHPAHPIRPSNDRPVHPSATPPEPARLEFQPPYRGPPPNPPKPPPI